MINQDCLRGKTYEGEVVDLSKYMSVSDCYFKDCDIIIKNEEGRSYIRSGGFNNVVFDNCRIKPGKIGVQKLSRDNPTVFKNTKIDIISSDLKNNFFRAFLSEEIPNDWKYYMSKYWSGCTINGEPIKEFNSSEYKDGFDFLDEKLPKFSKEDEKLIKISKENEKDVFDFFDEQLPKFWKEDEQLPKFSKEDEQLPTNSKKNEIDKNEKQLSIVKAIEETKGVDMGFQKGMLDVEFDKLIKELNSSESEDVFAFFDKQLPTNSKKNEIDEYEKQLSILEAIEETSGVDMGFQKGMLDVEFGKLIYVKNPNDENYSSYDAGLEYAVRQRNNMISKFTNVLDDNKFTKK